jgi:hypothetical protein
MTPSAGQPPQGPPSGAPPEGAPPPPAPLPPPAPQPSWAEVMEVLKSDHQRGMRVDVETDSTISPDPQAEQQAAVEFITALGTYLQTAIPAVAAGQFPADVAGQILLFVTRRFTVARDLEATLEDWVESLSTGQAQIAPPVDPAMATEELKQKGEQQSTAQKMDFERQKFDHESTLARDQFSHQQAQDQRANQMPFAMGEDGAPVEMGPALQEMAAQHEAEMGQLTQILVPFLQALSQQQQAQLEISQKILAALSQPRRKQSRVVTRPDGAPMGVETLEEPIG